MWWPPFLARWWPYCWSAADLPNDLLATDAIVRTKPQPRNKMVLGLPFAHLPSCFADDRRRSHDIDAVDPGQVRTAHAKQPFAQIELWRISLLLPASSLALFFRQRGTLAAILSLLEIL